MKPMYRSATGPMDKHTSFPALAPVDVAKEGDSVSQSLAVLSTVYHYNHWIFDSIRPFLGSAILEVGAGVGNITQFMLNAGRLVCLEPFPPYREYLQSRFASHLNLSVFPLKIEDCPTDEVPPGGFDSAVCLNVLEHIQDDVGALVRMKELVRPGGRVVVLVPAMQFAYGAMDQAMGHIRRYSRSSLQSAFRAAGLTVEHARYLNFIGLLGWWWTGRVLKRQTVPVSAARKFDRVAPFLSALERLIPPLFGQSVLVVGRAGASGLTARVRGNDYGARIKT